MKCKLKVYSNQDKYKREFPDREETLSSIKEALKKAREGVAKVRYTNKFIGYKIFELSPQGDEIGVKYYLPSN